MHQDHEFKVIKCIMAAQAETALQYSAISKSQGPAASQATAEGKDSSNGGADGKGYREETERISKEKSQHFHQGKG